MRMTEEASELLLLLDVEHLGGRSSFPRPEPWGIRSRPVYFRCSTTSASTAAPSSNGARRTCEKSASARFHTLRSRLGCHLDGDVKTAQQVAAPPQQLFRRDGARVVYVVGPFVYRQLHSLAGVAGIVFLFGKCFAVSAARWLSGKATVDTLRRTDKVRATSPFKNGGLRGESRFRAVHNRAQVVYTCQVLASPYF